MILYASVCKSAASEPETKDPKLNGSNGISGLFNMEYLHNKITIFYSFTDKLTER